MVGARITRRSGWALLASRNSKRLSNTGWVWEPSSVGGVDVHLGHAYKVYLKGRGRSRRPQHTKAFGGWEQPQATPKTGAD